MSWLKKGYETVQKEEARLAQSRGPDRFWLPKTKTKKVVFVDDEPACIHEINPVGMDGKYNNWFTSPKSDPSYPDMEEAMRLIGRTVPNSNPYYVGYYTVIDCDPYQDKKGVTHQYELKLFPAKIGTLKTLRSRSAKFGGLAGKLIDIERTDGDKSPSCGDVFDLDREVDLDQLWEVVTYQRKKLKDQFAEALEDEAKRSILTNVFNFPKTKDGGLVAKVPTFNYEALLAPKSFSELKLFLSETFPGGGSVGTSSNAPRSGSVGADEDVPF